MKITGKIVSKSRLNRTDQLDCTETLNSDLFHQPESKSETETETVISLLMSTRYKSVVG